jgi:cation transport ATPase
MTSPTSSPEAERAALGGTAAQTFQADLACVACAEAVERALRQTPHVTGVHVDYAARTVHVTFHAAMISPVEIQRRISTAAYGGHCTPQAPLGPGVGGDLQALAHQADMASVTMGTAVDRMQYEFPATTAGHLHHVADGVQPGGTTPVVSDQGPHAGRAGMATAPAAAPAGHAAMGHDMSDPRLARAMEADMRNRFFVALALTIPTIVFSPLVMNTVHVRFVGMTTANWLMLLFSTPLVWWSGWPRHFRGRDRLPRCFMLRDPLDYLTSEGLEVECIERSRWGIVERLLVQTQAPFFAVAGGGGTRVGGSVMAGAFLGVTRGGSGGQP